MRPTPLTCRILPGRWLHRRAQLAVTFHAPVAFINGGPRDLAYQGALTAFDGIENVPALFAFQDVGHYPATYREPNGGAFAVLVNAWLRWQLKGDQSAAKMFVGAKLWFLLRFQVEHSDEECFAMSNDRHGMADKSFLTGLVATLVLATARSRRRC